jgi:hypothetical protein
MLRRDDPNLDQKIEQIFAEQESAGPPQRRERPDNWNDLTPEQQAEDRRERGREYRAQVAEYRRQQVEDRRREGRGETAERDDPQQLVGQDPSQSIPELLREILMAVRDMNDKLDQFGGMA